LNSARQLITQLYLRNCHGIFAVCDIGRATTDVSVTSVFGLANEAELSNVGIVCTNSDVSYDIPLSNTNIYELTAIQRIQAEEAKIDWPGVKANLIQRLQDAIATDGRDIEATETELEAYEGDYNELDEWEREEAHELRKRAKEVKQVPCNPFEFTC
jgi:hypothetical protein